MKTSRHNWQLVLWSLVVSNCVYKVMWRFLMQRYVFPATFATSDVIFPVTFNLFCAFSPVKISVSTKKVILCLTTEDDKL